MTIISPSFELDSGVATIRLNRPDVGNAIDLPGARALRDGVRGLAAADVSVVVIRAEGRMFCVGGDVKTVAAAPDRQAFVAEIAGTLHEGLVALRELPIAIVAVVQGTVAGAGNGLVLAADVVLASEHATFLSAFAEVGLSPDCGVSALLPAVVGPRRAALFALTGLTLDAATALDWGLVSEVCAADALGARADEVVAGLVAQPGRAVGETARLFRVASERTYAAHLADEAATVTGLAVSPEADARLRQFAEAR